MTTQRRPVQCGLAACICCLNRLGLQKMRNLYIYCMSAHCAHLVTRSRPAGEIQPCCTHQPQVAEFSRLEQGGDGWRRWRFGQGFYTDSFLFLESIGAPARWDLCIHRAGPIEAEVADKQPCSRAQILAMPTTGTARPLIMRAAAGTSRHRCEIPPRGI